MKSPRWSPAIFAVAVLTGMATSACRPTLVVVPRPAGGYSATDTLRAIHNGNEVRVTFRFDTIMRVDTVTRVDTAWVEGTRTLVRVDTLLRVDTLHTLVTDTVVRAQTIVRIDTVRVPTTETIIRVDTRVDTVRVPVTGTLVRVDTRVDTVRVPVTATLVRVDTVRVAVTDTVIRVDTIRVAATDTVIRTVTVRVPGRRLLFVPPGHYPPDGQCRVWIHSLPPGQQARAAACAELGEIPGGAFVLFGGDAWDFDYDWIAEAAARPDAVPPEIIALKRRP